MFDTLNHLIPPKVIHRHQNAFHTAPITHPDLYLTVSKLSQLVECEITKFRNFVISRFRFQDPNPEFKVYDCAQCSDAYQCINQGTSGVINIICNYTLAEGNYTQTAYYTGEDCRGPYDCGCKTMRNNTLFIDSSIDWDQ